MIAARQLAQRLRAAIDETPLQVEGKSIGVTASFGVAVCPAAGIADAMSLIDAADRAMYRAKANGGSRVELDAQRPNG